MVSVIMSVLNEERKIEESVRSILDGTYKDIEFIIVDDGSTDNTFGILASISKRDSRVVLIKNEVNIGISKSLNKAISIAKYDYIARQDADDISHPDRLEKQLAYFQEHNEIQFVGSGVNMVDNGSNYGCYMFPEKVDKKLLLAGNPYNHPTILFRKQALQAVGLYATDERVTRCEDWDLYIRLFAAGFEGANMQQILVDYYESTSRYKHTFKTRLNESYVQRKGARLFKCGFYGRFNAFKTMLKAFVPTFIYRKLHLRKYKNN